MNLKGRNFLTLKDFTPEEITYLIDLSAELKAKKKAGELHEYYRGKNIALIFEKTSTRTRCSFEVAAHDLGMGSTYLDPTGSQIGKKESIADTARVLGRMYDGIEYRGFAQDVVEELAKYGKDKGVALYLWYNSNGYWNDAPQTPRGIMDNAIARRKEMKWMQSIGIRGIKVDFFGGDKQMTMQLYEDILSDANEYGLLVIFHGCTLPRGWERMYPNFASSEAVLASENLHFSQGSCDHEAFNATLHPFIRNTVGSMDFGGSALNKYYNADNAPRGSRRVTSDVYALATAESGTAFCSGTE